MFEVSKSTSINLRITPEFRAQMEILAAYYGLSLSSFAHSILVREVRKERERLPELFPSERAVNHLNGVPVAPKSKTGGIPMIKPKTQTRRKKAGVDVRQKGSQGYLQQGQERQADIRGV